MNYKSKIEGDVMNYKSKIKAAIKTKALKAFAKSLKRQAGEIHKLKFEFDDIQLAPNGPTYGATGIAEFEMEFESASGDGFNEPREDAFFYCDESTVTITNITVDVFSEETQNFDSVTDPNIIESIKNAISDRVTQLCINEANSYAPDPQEPPDPNDDYYDND